MDKYSDNLRISEMFYSRTRSHQYTLPQFSFYSLHLGRCVEFPGHSLEHLVNHLMLRALGLLWILIYAQQRKVELFRVIILKSPLKKLQNSLLFVKSNAVSIASILHRIITQTWIVSSYCSGKENYVFITAQVTLQRLSTLYGTRHFWNVQLFGIYQFHIQDCRKIGTP